MNPLDLITGNVDYGAMYAGLKNKQLAQNTANANQAIDVATGQAEAGGRQNASNISLAGNRSNLAGPITNALTGRANARANDLASNLSAGIKQNAADKATQITNTMDQAGLDANIQQTQSTQQMIGNIISGIGQTAGTIEGTLIKAGA